ncbi:MAG: bifunctional folylpolyglutamate synthase/dihydrofolate synthase, partial [Rhodobacteraceae bacterium]|nr:bifunctional folylpolyglutamate synthase/dihydrofolate synthase [Paracoccaceae bacterium]
TYWPARMQRLSEGPLVELLPENSELWLDGGHNPAGGAAIAATLAGMSTKPTHIICGMLTTKDAGGFLGHLAPQAQSFTAVTLNTEQNMLPAEELAQAASQAGMKATASDSLLAAVSTLSAQQPGCRILICGSLYLVGHILQTNG